MSPSNVSTSSRAGVAHRPIPNVKRCLPARIVSTVKLASKSPSNVETEPETHAPGGITTVTSPSCVADRVGNGDIAFNGVYFDTSLGLGKCHSTFDRFERDAARATSDLDIALHGLGLYGAARPVDTDVGIGAAQRHRHPDGHRNVEIHDGRWAPPADRAHQHGAAGRRDIDFAAARVAGAHAHVVLSPGVHHDLAAEVIDVEPGALLDRDRRETGASRDTLNAPPSRRSGCSSAPG